MNPDACSPLRWCAANLPRLIEHGAARERIHSESFSGAPVAPDPAAAPRTPVPAAGAGPAVAFSRSGVATAWDGAFTTLLDLAEACAVPAASGCRSGACHGCRTAVLAGAVRHDPEPLERPPPGSALLCCAVPDGDVVLDA